MLVTVGKASEIAPGDMSVVDVNGVQVAVANVGGTFYAFDDTCTHLQCSLSEGDLEDVTLTCPCHGSQFDVTTGDAVTGPAFEPVRSYELSVEGDEIRIDV